MRAASIDTILLGRKTYDWAVNYCKKIGKPPQFDAKVPHLVFSRKPPRNPAPRVESASETERHTSTEAVPIVGRAPAGALMLAEQNVEVWVRLPREFLRLSARDYFLVRIRHNSMNLAEVSGDRIEDSDLILVRRQDEAKNSDGGVAVLDGEVTVKRLSIANGYVVLRPVSSKTHHESFLLTRHASPKLLF